MRLREALAALVKAAPSDATVPVRWIEELLTADRGEVELNRPADIAVIDLTVKEVADRFGRKESTIRTWAASGELEGAYRLHGREWRIPISSIEKMQRAQTKRRSRTHERGERRAADVGEWRKHLPREQGSQTGVTLAIP